MSLTLVKEDGSGAADANSYASASDGDTYHDAHLYASDWTAATTANKEKALAMATRLIDSCYQFNGFRASNSQALQWPRRLCVDPDRESITSQRLLYGNNLGPYFDSDTVPQAVINATCEVARELIKADSTDAADSQEMQEIKIAGSISLTFDKKDKQPTISETAQFFLSKLGVYQGGRSSSAKLVRV
jgi:hypothetical protein